ncbi:hypothetical protein BC749_101592 [Flavobacterium araucananum]|nr:hypothetical protein BC749_101592 [Flavobacterium araucananum]
MFVNTSETPFLSSIILCFYVLKNNLCKSLSGKLSGVAKKKFKA